MKITVAYLGALGREHRHPRHAIPPLRAAYATSALRAAGHDVDLIDTAAPAAARTVLTEHIARRRPDLLIADARIETVDQIVPLARAVRRHTGTIIAAGPPAEAMAAERHRGLGEVEAELHERAPARRDEDLARGEEV